ncbi:MAG: PorV/PorQ family protein [Melioribacteraceae bacterium]|nr:PorV/PorQ family protein [Melioribacteraceae bacterium]
MKKFICILFLLSVSIITAQNKVGTTAAEFLTIPVGSKAMGMGGAFTGLADDITAAFYNPGSLSRIEGNQFISNYSEWLVDSKYSWFGLGIKASDDDYITLSVTSLDYGDEEVTTISEPEGTGQMWNASDIAIALSYSRNLTDRFSIGGSVKYIQQKIWNESASSFAIDLGLLYKTQVDGLNIGMSITNFGTQMKLDGKDLLTAVDVDQSYNYNNSTITSGLSTDEWELPLVFTVGSSWRFNLWDEFAFTTAVDAVIPSNANTHINLGSELQWNNIFFARIGKSSLFKENAQEGLTFGAGIKYELSGIKVAVEYAYLDFGMWSNLNRYSITIGF